MCVAPVYIDISMEHVHARLPEKTPGDGKRPGYIGFCDACAPLSAAYPHHARNSCRRYTRRWKRKRWCSVAPPILGEGREVDAYKLPRICLSIH
ncbi:hypothetical protein Trydic_g14401 [Trypoxylus dichotomus]